MSGLEGRAVALIINCTELAGAVATSPTGTSPIGAKSTVAFTSKERAGFGPG